MGVSCPGIVDPESGVCLFAANFDWDNVKVRDFLEEALSLPVLVENDLKAEALGEFWFGVGQGVSNLVCLKVDNGVGAGVIVEGHLYRGTNNFVGEVGHIMVDPNGERCTCGHIGCLQMKVREPSILKMARDEVRKHPKSPLARIPPDRLTLKDIFDPRFRRDPLAREIFDRVSTFLGVAVATVINMYDPEMVILSGSVVEAGDGLLERVKAIERRQVLKTVIGRVRIEKMSFKEKAGIIGGAAVVFHWMLSGGGSLMTPLRK